MSIQCDKERPCDQELPVYIMYNNLRYIVYGDIESYDIIG